jgi:hypothetical protein
MCQFNLYHIGIGDLNLLLAGLHISSDTWPVKVNKIFGTVSFLWMVVFWDVPQKWYTAKDYMVQKLGRPPYMLTSP